MPANREAVPMLFTTTPCAGDLRWDLDHASAAGVVAAKDGCARCPILAQCAKAVGPDSDPKLRPQCMVQAGVAFGPRGQPLDDAELKLFLQRRRKE
jgi:hypothetical protein